MNKIKTLSVLGPTASGKTGLAIELARRLDGEVVSCDSMQIYRGMDIGTATPTMEERAGIVHHLFDIVDPEDDFSAADYAKAAAEVIEDVALRGKTPILCGGTGMYYDSLMKITSFSESVQNEALREELYEFALAHGNDALHARLREIDPESADAIHPNNVKRVIRAIEMYMTTGRTKTEIDREQIAGETRYDDTAIILDYADRAILYDRIERRVDIMIEDGLIPEIERIFMSGRSISRTASQAIGYKELIPYLRGECTLEEATAELKLATRHYAKRQIMWFRRYENAIRIAPDRDGRVMSAAELADEILVLENKI